MLYAHFLDTPGIPIEIKHIDEKSLTVALFTSHVIANADNSSLIPSHKQIPFVETFKNKTHLNQNLRKYFTNLLDVLCLCLNENDFTKAVSVSSSMAIAKYLEPLIDKNSLLHEFVGPLCGFCVCAKQTEPKDLTKILVNNKYR